jgi:hypothetical protein
MATGHRMRPPGLEPETVAACHLQHPGERRRFACPFIPAFRQPSRGGCTVGSHHDVSRGCYEFTCVAARCFACIVQGHLSPWITPRTRPPARPPNGQLRPGDLHPISLMPVPACSRRSAPGDAAAAALAPPATQKSVTIIRTRLRIVIVILFDWR